MPATITFTGALTVLECGNCHIEFAIPASMLVSRQRDGNDFWCPNGHRIHYFENDNAKLRKRLDRETETRRWYSDQLDAANNEVKHQRRVAAAARGRITKMRNRIAAGVCPAPGCKRSGLGNDVVAHLKSCHPDFVIADDA